MNVSFDENNVARPVAPARRLSMGEKISKASNGSLSVDQARYLMLGTAILMFGISIWLMIPHRSNSVDTTVVNMPGARP